jgi:hypothetical protein
VQIQTARTAPRTLLPVPTRSPVEPVASAMPATSPARPRVRSSLALVAALSLAAVAPVATGCAVEDEATGQGSIVMPLVQTGPDGSVYQLFNAAFEIVGPGGSQIISGDFDSTLSLSLPVGLTTIRLLDGWQLWRTPGIGSIAEHVPALLGTANPFTLRVLANYTETVSFGFLVRDRDGVANITLGVTPEPRELAGGVRISGADGAFEPYITSNRLDFAFYFEVSDAESTILPDGTRERAFYAGIYSSDRTPVAAEFFNDGVGLLSSAVGPSLAGGYLEYRLGARPDGSTEIVGTFFGGGEPFTTIDFGPYTLKAPLPLDAEGFPADVFFHDDSVPFTMQTFFESGPATMSGFLNLRHIP